MKDIFVKAGIEVTKENKKKLDEAIHSYVGVEYKNCSPTWKAVKEQLLENEDAFIEMLRNSIKY